ncbi:hypothetical protein PMIN06_003068 [Paraphaeosphaeria minitans]|uniref:Uncharacterized protein n=1 Tax=Paraphaeosphaeria minitans TaxID=565426 RepID=A0A9P6GHG8_9PLEO|nr:hypothetical protein PMIN01_07157 [Paraphaeosphaeria minitans]
MADMPTPMGIFGALWGSGDRSRGTQWMQFLSRIAELINLSFSTEREAMFNYRLVKSEYAKGVHNITLEPLSAPAAHKPFCDAEVDNPTKLQALYLSQCVHSVILSTPLLAYLSSHCDIRVREYDIYIDPRVFTNCTNTSTRNHDPLHSVLFVSPPFLPVTATGSCPFKDPGMILDPSAHQMGFEETFQCAENYLSTKFNYRKKGHKSNPLGSHLNRFKVLFSPLSLYKNNPEFRHGISLRAICNVLYEEIERMGEPRAVVSLEAAEWGRFFDALRVRLKRELRQLRVQLDDVQFAVLRTEYAEDRGRELMNQDDKDGYRNMMALASDPYPQV